MNSSNLRLLTNVLLILIVFTTVTTGQNLKPFEVNDLLKIEQLGDLVTFSPDGQMIAFTIQRSISSELNNYEIFTNDRSDIWLYDLKSEKAVSITNGASDGSAFWGPIWSPSGDFLAMLSTRGAPKAHAHLWIWDKKKSQLQHLGERNLDVENDYFAAAILGVVFWLSDEVIVFPALTSIGSPGAGRSVKLGMNDATQLWIKAQKGQEPTATVFESGRRIDAREFEQGKYVSYNLTTGEYSDLADHYIEHFSSQFAPPTIPAPNRQTVAVFVVNAEIPLRGDQKFGRYNNYRYKIKLFDGKRELVFNGLDQVKNTVPHTLAWSPDGRRFVFIGSYDENLDLEAGQSENAVGTNELCEFTLNSGTVEKVSIGNLVLVPQNRGYFYPAYGFAWSADNRIVIKAVEKNISITSSEEEKNSDWWILEEGKFRNITSLLKFSPEKLYLIKKTSSFLCVGEGNLWRISSRGNSIINLTENFEPRIVSIIWTDEEASYGKPINRIICETQSSNGSIEYYSFDFTTEEMKIQLLKKPNSSAEFKTFSLASQKALFIDSNRMGTFLWLTGTADFSQKMILEKNAFLRTITEAKVNRIQYVSLNGEHLAGWVILPANYKNGEKYPLITWVYQSEQYPNRPLLSKINFLNPLNLQLAASKGYSVLFPSMPGKMHSYQDLLNGVMPAVDKVIEMGIADPNRIAVMGQSNGGYSTYGLITQTDRFKAAVAMAGLTDLASISLEFMPGQNQRQLKEVFFARLALMERSMGFGLPWKDLSYLLNSPLYYASRVKTPLLILHGDLDGVPIRQAEEFFTALYRQGSRAKFVYYWGEGHVIGSPANIKHMWQQIFSWFDEYLGSSDEKNK